MSLGMETPRKRLDPSAIPIPAIGCSDAARQFSRPKRGKPANPARVFGHGGPRTGPRYEVMRVQQWLTWITGHSDWVPLATVARAIGWSSDRIRGVLRRYEIPRRYDARGRTMLSLSTLPLLLDTVLLAATHTTSGKPRPPSRRTGTIRQHLSHDSRV